MTERQARAFERGVPGARVVRWPHASHYLFLTRQAEVVKEVTAFLAALR
jgi:pimeloyl-ACP methyl ester carboxylesterase